MVETVLEEQEKQTAEEQTTQAPVETEYSEGICMYVVSEGRLPCLVRLFASVLASSRLPNRIVLLSTNKQVLDDFGLQTMLAQLNRAGCLTDKIVLGKAHKHLGLAAQKNVALTIASRGKYAYGFSVDDDHVLDPFCIERLEAALQTDPSLFAVGPCIRQPGDTGISQNKQSMLKHIGKVSANGTWIWGGFRQGVKYISTKYKPIPVDHLACAYMHSLDTDRQYDITYDRPIYFMHESDFLYGTKQAVIPQAIVHHWPQENKNMTATRSQHIEDIFANIRYFAEKHSLGTVTRSTWKGFLDTNI